MSDVSTSVSVATALSQKEVTGSAVVTQTLDTLNRTSKKSATSQSDMAASYEFNRSILSATYDTKGNIADLVG